MNRASCTRHLNAVYSGGGVRIVRTPVLGGELLRYTFRHLDFAGQPVIPNREILHNTMDSSYRSVP